MALVDINWKPSDRNLRIFAGLQWLFCGAVASWVTVQHGAPQACLILLGISTGLAIVGFTAPPWIRPVYVGWMAAVFPMGWVVSHAVFAAVYFLVITPIGLVLRAAGYDPLERTWDSQATTYWKPRGEPPSPSRYFRQF